MAYLLVGFHAKHFCFFLYHRTPYELLVGGVLALTPEQFENVNGYSNNFYGWGGEDDDIAYR